MRKSLAILAACGLLLLTSAPGTAQDVPAQDIPTWPGRLGAYVFEVTRDGKPIGTQTVTLKQDGDVVTVTTESTIAVKMLGIVVYRMHQVLTDVYRGQRLVEVSAETKDPQGFRAGKITRDGDRWTGKLGQQRRDFACDCASSSTMPQLAILKGGEMIEASEVQRRSVSIADRGTETLDLPEGSVKARHFAVKGEIEREVWYDPAGNLVAAQQIGSDGSLIRQTLMSDPQATRATGQEASEP
ncbi:DUF6134 family protein [Dongia sedimenti]|uniref:DUF6134 family protein n=1 Tax=Dongia sedimenti TaxID=3064282 RepID=A0ABU0YP23_9PROT|nr:DUF6134 family protein [Rhodospirillaceae bacterium R-7]